MKQALRVLIVEDNPADAQLVVRELRRAKHEPEWTRVETEPDFLAALEKKPDLILSDFAMPQFSGLRALELLRQRDRETPFILISGTVGEDTAVEAMKMGATDYLIKDRLARLGPSVTRALRQAQERVAHQRAELRSAAFSKLGEKLGSAKTPRDAAEIIVEVADQLSPWDACAFYFYSRQTNRIHSLLNKDLIQGRRTDCPPAHNVTEPSPLARQAIEEGAQLILREEPAGPVSGAIPFGDTNRPSASLMFVPVRDGATVVGVLSIQSYAPRAYDREDLDTLQALADHCAGAMIRIQSTEALRESEGRFREMLENLELIAMTLNQYGAVTFCNDYLLKLTGWNRAEVVGADWFAKFIPEARQAETKIFFDKIEAGAVPLHHENVIKSRTGELRDIVWNNTMLRDGSGNVIGVAGIGEDVTERRLLESQLRQSQKMEAIGQLAGGVAHDFNNLLTVILCNVEMLLASEKLEGEDADSLKDVVKASQAAAQLTRQLLIFSRKQTMQAQVFDLNETVGNLIKMLRRVIGEHIHLRWEPAGHLPKMKGDPGMIEQVIMNLAVNARDAMPKDGELFIGTDVVTLPETPSKTNPDAQAGEFIRLTVRDTGGGIAPDVLPRIFEPFFTTKEVGKGTGLGLATVFGIVKQHHGWIEVESKVEELMAGADSAHGTMFRIYLSGDLQPAEAEPMQNQLVLIRGGTETILLVEDEPSLRSLARRILQRHGYTVFEAGSGVEALTVWRERDGKFDLLLTDMVMPDGLSGRELADLVRTERPGLKVIFSSGYSAELAKTDFISRHEGFFLPKPYEQLQLAQLVRKCLDTDSQKKSTGPIAMATNARPSPENFAH